MRLKSLLLAIATCCCCTGMAQVVPLDTLPQGVKPLRSLSTAGLKYMPFNVLQSPTFNLLNEDFSLYRVITLPPPPAGYSYNYVSYVTEDLFDTDPSTIEYMITASSNMTYQLFVYREDGSTVFNAPGSPNTTVGGNGLTGGYDAVVQTTMGPVLHVSTGLLGPDTRRYLLPGHLPCITCSDGMVSGTGGDMSAPDHENGLLTFPNPASEFTTVEYQLHSSNNTGLFILYDAEGRSVFLHQVDASGRLRVPTQQLSNGVYHAFIVEDGLSTPGCKVVVAH